MKWNIDFDRAPLLVIWEVTRACALACRHCRASAEDFRHPEELTTEQGYRLLDNVAAMGTPLMIFSGGDPLQRNDLEDLVRYAKSINLRAGTIPATTDRLTKERLLSLQAAGLDQVAVSLDGPDATSHDEFRRVQGSFDRAMAGARWAREIGLPLQVNSVFGSWNADAFDRMADLVQSLGVVFWEVFFLVPTGRGTELQGVTVDQMASIFDKLYERSKTCGFVIKVTEGSQHRAYLAGRGGPQQKGGHPGGHPGGSAHPRLGMSPKTVNAGRGFLFVDHIGNICPSGFLPLFCGNVKRDDLATVYREHRVFKELRDATLLKGWCHTCVHRDVCTGGSRARAYALTGDYLEAEPVCPLVTPKSAPVPV